MMSSISDLINSKMEQFRRKLEIKTKKTMPYYVVPIGYTLLGSIVLIIVPSVIFTIMEGRAPVDLMPVVVTLLCLDWDMTDAVYYSFISLSTIGFGDFVPRNDPPTKHATYVRNDTMCFEVRLCLRGPFSFI